MGGLGGHWAGAPSLSALLLFYMYRENYALLLPQNTHGNKRSFMWSINYLKVGAKDSMNLGDRIFLPITVEEVPSERTECFCNEEEIDFLRSLELYKVLKI